MYTLQQVKNITGAKSPNHPESRYRFAWDKEMRMFSKYKIDTYLEIKQEKEWFTLQVQLFVEYLNKIKYIKYSKIAKETNFNITNIAKLTFGYKEAVKILVKFRKYVKRFEEYYCI